MSQHARCSREHHHARHIRGSSAGFLTLAGEDLALGDAALEGERADPDVVRAGLDAVTAAAGAAGAD